MSDGLPLSRKTKKRKEWSDRRAGYLGEKDGEVIILKGRQKLQILDRDWADRVALKKRGKGGGVT